MTGKINTITLVTCAVLLSLSVACSEDKNTTDKLVKEQSVKTPSAKSDNVIARDKILQRIAFGSCARQMQDAPLFNTVVAASPDLFLMIGDVVYPDINDEATALLDPWPSKDSIKRIKQVYTQMAAKPEKQYSDDGSMG